MKIRANIIASRDPASLAHALQAADGLTATVESEFGDILVPGHFTLAHHGPGRKHLPPPCCWPAGALPRNHTDIEVIGVSHLDLDTLGGIIALQGGKNAESVFGDAVAELAFWPLAAFLDVAGPHRIEEGIAMIPGGEGAARQIRAYWAWARSHKIQWPPMQADAVVDVTALVQEHINVLGRILKDDENYLVDGDRMLEEEKALNSSSFMRVASGGPGFKVVVRVADGFVNHLYTTPTGEVCQGCLALNTQTGAVTLSWADPDNSPDSAACIMRGVFGPEAGGHAGIAGTPRNQRYGLADLDKVLDYL